MTDDLASFIVRILLRYFRKGVTQETRSSDLHEADRDMLLLQWSISDEVKDLCTYLSRHPHELRSALHSRVASSSGAIRGAIRASQTVVEQAVTSDPTRFVFVEPFRSYESGTNRLLGWTLFYAMTLSRRFRAMLSAEASYYDRTVDSLRLIEDVRRQLPFVTSVSPPTASDFRAACSSKSLLYRKAAAAYEFLREIERLDEAALQRLLATSLVGPMERWRQFEFALALAMASAIGQRVGAEIRLKNIQPTSMDSIVEVGNYVIRWQKAGPMYETPSLDNWEQRVERIVLEYGLRPGYDRPDVVVYNRDTGVVLAIGEAKYFEMAPWTDMLRDAVAQVVLYARGYERAQNVEELIGRSLIALWSIEGETPGAITNTTPIVTTFDGMQAGLSQWVARALP